MPEGAEDGILRGHVSAPRGRRRGEGKPRVQLLGPARSCARCIAAAELLEQDCGVLADVWSVTAFSELRRDGHRDRALEHAAPARGSRGCPTSPSSSAAARGPVIASTDYMRSVRPTRSGLGAQPYAMLGTDGFGRSDYRARTLRRFFEVDRHYVDGRRAARRWPTTATIARQRVAEAIAQLRASTPTAPMPTTGMSATSTTRLRRS